MNSRKQGTRILILGSGGLIGREVSLIARKYIANSVVIGIDKNDIDLTNKNSVEEIREVIKDRSIDHILNLAAIKRQDSDSNITKAKNDLISENVSHAIANTSTFCTYISSTAVYGEKNSQINIDESLGFNPTSLYGEHKASSELLYRERIEKKRLLIVRPPLIYGKEDMSGYNPGGFLNLAKSKKAIALWGGGEELREFIYLRDAALILSTLISKEISGTVNMTSASSYSYAAIAEHIRNYTGCSVTQRPRSGELVNHTYKNNELLRRIGQFDFLSPISYINQNL